MPSAEFESSAPALERGQHLIAGRYRTLNRIGRGRLGEIFAALDETYEEIGVEQHRAIQIIPESVVQINKLFNKLDLGYRELRASSHPNIVDYTHFGRDGKMGFLVMELLDGASLRLVLDDAETLPLEEAKPVIRGAGEALRLLHTKGMVHGNLSTRNVFITDDLEVRLLDVLPVDPAEALVRGIATSDPFSRCSVEDDVSGLACLAYEMLSGRHPFNFSSVSESRLAGLEAKRIDSLSDSEWDALHRALSFDHEERTSSIAEFMHEFGIDGKERLRPTSDKPATPEPVAYPAAAESRPTTRPAVIEKPTAPVGPVSVMESRPAHARPLEKRSGPLRAVFLGMLLAGLGAWSYFGQPEEFVVSWIGYLDERLELGLTQQNDALVDIPTVDSGQTVATDRDAQVDQPAPAAPEAASEVAQADSEARQSEPEAASNDGDVESSTTGDVAATSPPADEPSAETNTDSLMVAPELIVTESIVLVSEGDGAARIVTQRNDNPDAPLIWWTRGHTAIADDDFIPVEQRPMTQPPDADIEILHVPLVNDSLPEQHESFFVNIGLHDAQQGQIERIATVRVDIIDDD